ncbi:MAG: hypothetical protein J07HQW1_02674 [Haloquadratum walsbyi J07HQW1]|uniref:Uncharacterized protein n=1 Tax=Haloquadratum walsbyi J07HQW1 TaxID=1238424 RepID=U1MRA9_9EURY|nr:MAG: hypothetical protein J07HQW1_02674 [Haloquadratum walsbyi J07HQW1]
MSLSFHRLIEGKSGAGEPIARMHNAVISCWNCEYREPNVRRNAHTGVPDGTESVCGLGEKQWFDYYRLVLQCFNDTISLHQSSRVAASRDKSGSAFVSGSIIISSAARSYSR